MFIPIDKVITPSSRASLTIHETREASPPPPPVVYRRRKPADAKAVPQDTCLRADQSYNEVRHMAYLAVIQEAYRHVSLEG